MRARGPVCVGARAHACFRACASVRVRVRERACACASERARGARACESPSGTATTKTVTPMTSMRRYSRWWMEWSHDYTK